MIIILHSRNQDSDNEPQQIHNYKMRKLEYQIRVLLLHTTLSPLSFLRYHWEKRTWIVLYVNFESKK